MEVAIHLPDDVAAVVPWELVVADTSALNYLLLIHQETLLPILYDRVGRPDD